MTPDFAHVNINLGILSQYQLMAEIIKQLKREIVGLAKNSGEGHIPSAFSILDILWVLYHDVLNIDSKHPTADNRDRFILSKGQAGLGLFVVLSQKGFFPKEQLQSYCKFESNFGGHPDRNKVPGVEASTGSLGHGFPMAVGTAMALKIQNNPARVFCLIGDGEANEGSIWEAALLGAHHKLNNLYCIVDFNHSTDRALELGDLQKKFESFGWDSVVINGHNHQEIQTALTKKSERPVAIVAETIKGKGVSLMENNPAWHHKAPSEEEYMEIMDELKE